MKLVSLVCYLLSFAILLSQAAHADTFGSGTSSFEIEFVTIGQPGNPPDDPVNPAGAVDYAYRMGKYEVSEQMIDKANALGGLGITKDTRGPDKPATSVTWFEAAKYVNWLNTSTGSVPAYKFDNLGAFQLWLPTDPGYNAQNLYRNSLAKYFLPSVDEWHKAAYYDPAAGHYWDYPTGSDVIPDGIDFVGDTVVDAVFRDLAANPEPNNITDVGILSPNGTAGQGGNVAEWEETAFDRINNQPDKGRRNAGGAWVSGPSLLNAQNTLIGTIPSFEHATVGFRVSSAVPEPSAIFALAIGLSILFGPKRLRRNDI